MNTSAPYLLLLVAVALTTKSIANDHFPDRQPLSGALPLVVEADLEGATAEGGEPIHSSERFVPNHRVNSRWWTWRAPAGGWYQVDARGAAPTVVAIYTGDLLDRLVRRAASPGAGGNGSGLVQFEAQAGVDYHIALSGQHGVGGTVAFELNAAPPAAANDEFANRGDLGSALDVAVTGNATGATAEPGEPVLAGRLPRSTIWWQMRPEGNQHYRVSAEAHTGSRVRLAVFEGAELGALAAVRSALPYPDGTIAFDAKAGSSYQIVVDGAGNPGPVTLCVKAVGAPPNDDIVDAIDLGDAGAARLEADLTFATREAAETSGIVRSAWWRWRAPMSSRYVVQGVEGGSPFPSTQAVVYSGNLFTGLRHLPTVARQAIAFDAEAGENYFIGIGGISMVHDRETAFELRPIPEITNDDFEDAADLPDELRLRLPAHNIGATVQVGEPPSDITRPLEGTVWWRWRPSLAGSYRIWLADATFPRSLDVFTGDTLETLQPHTLRSFSVGLEVAAGETYFFRAQGLNGRAGFFTLAIDYLVPPANDDFADAIDLGRTADVRSESTTYGATVEASEPETFRPSTIWWRWQVPESGVWDLYSFDDADLDVFRGSTLADLEEVHRSVGVERTAFVAVADEVYYFRMGSAWGIRRC